MAAVVLLFQAGKPRTGGINAHCVNLTLCNRRMEHNKAILGLARGVVSGKGSKGGKAGKKNNKKGGKQ